jgi:hypothetical protein
MNEQNAATKVADATAAQLIAAIYTAKDNADDYAVRRELNRAAGHTKLALGQEAYEDGIAGQVAGFDITLADASLVTLQALAEAHRLRAEAADNAGATRELRRAEGHLACAAVHATDDAWEGDKVAKPETQTVEVEGIPSAELHGFEADLADGSIQVVTLDDPAAVEEALKNAGIED